jgi:hypothetical protein
MQTSRISCKHLKTHALLPYSFHIKDTTPLKKKLQEIPFYKHVRTASFDVTNMFTNIPIGQMEQIIRGILTNSDVDRNVINQ